MILNTFWAVPEDQEVSTVIDRTCVIDQYDNRFGECAVYGEVGIYGRSRNDAVMIRESQDGCDRIISIVDTPFSVEFWDTIDEERFTLNWTGEIWHTGPAMEFTDEELWVSLDAKTVEGLITKALVELGLPHFTATQIRDRKTTIELVDRQNWSKQNLIQGAYYYRDADSKDMKFTNDIEDLPDIAELEVLHYIDDSDSKDDYVKIFFDDDLTIDKTLERMRQNKDTEDVEVFWLSTCQSTSIDIVDMKEQAMDEVKHAHLVSKLYVVHKDEQAHRLFINMAFWFPQEAPYLV